MSKADYVRSQAGLGHNGKHTCHADGCTKPIAPAYLMCPAHWRMVPAEIQRRIWLLYRPGQEVDKRPTGQYITAMKDAIAAVAKAEGEQRQSASRLVPHDFAHLTANEALAHFEELRAAAIARVEKQIRTAPDRLRKLKARKPVIDGKE